MGGETAEEDVVPQILIAGEVRRVPGVAVVHDGEVVLLRRPPDRLQVGVVHRDVLAEHGQDRRRPLRSSPLRDLAHGLVHGARGGHDRGLQARRELSAEIGRVTMIGADQSDLELDVRQSDDAHPERGHHEMRICPLVVHVLDPVLGLVILHAHPRLLRPHPVGAAAGERVVRAGRPEHAAIELRGDPVLIGVGRASDHLARGDAVGRQLGEARPKVRIDVPIQDVRGGIDVRIGVPGAQAVSHGRLQARLS